MDVRTLFVDDSNDSTLKIAERGPGALSERPLDNGVQSTTFQDPDCQSALGPELQTLLKLTPTATHEDPSHEDPSPGPVPSSNTHLIDQQRTKINPI